MLFQPTAQKYLRYCNGEAVTEVKIQCARAQKPTTAPERARDGYRAHHSALPRRSAGVNEVFGGSATPAWPHPAATRRRRWLFRTPWCLLSLAGSWRSALPEVHAHRPAAPREYWNVQFRAGA